MRHYYRFMELEPVLEQEEDSVGEASPTSSVGSPSFSPPPDAWAQISGKDFHHHDPLSSHLLQEHLDLQRAYRLLEVQLQKADSRDLQRTTDSRLREELQKAREREEALRGEIYDLHEQNELLEFRILELEECQENASTRGAPPLSRDAATETDADDVTDAGRTSLPVADETQRIQERLRDESGSATEGCETRLAQDDQNHHSSALTITLDPEQVVQGHGEDTSHPLSEGISCTLCRRLPRRRSFPEPSPATTPELIKKSKSEGAIAAREGEVEEKTGGGEDVESPPSRVDRCVGTEGVTLREEGVQTEPRTPLFGGRVEEQVRTVRAMLASIYEVIQETRVEVECTNSELREEVQTLESTLQRLKEEASRGFGGAGEGPPPVRRSRSLSFSKECYCCSQDLQPNLEDVITKLQLVMNLVTDSGATTTTFDPLQKDDVGIPEPNGEEDPEGTQQEQEDTALQEENEGEASKQESVTEAISVQKKESENLSGVPEEMPVWKMKPQEQTQTKENPSPPPVKKAPPNETPLPKLIVYENSPKQYQQQWTPEQRADDYDLIRRSFESQDLPKAPETRKPEVMPKRADLLTNKDIDIPPLTGVNFTDPRDRFREYESCVIKGTDEAIKHLEELAPLPEEKTKPVLRRWREQLLVRRDRVQPWRIEMLDFPKRLPSVV